MVTCAGIIRMWISFEEGSCISTILLVGTVVIYTAVANSPINVAEIAYLWLEPIFLGPDSIPMTHETWQSSKASMIGIEIRFKIFIKQNTKYEGFF